MIEQVLAAETTEDSERRFILNFRFFKLSFCAIVAFMRIGMWSVKMVILKLRLDQAQATRAVKCTKM